MTVSAQRVSQPWFGRAAAIGAGLVAGVSATAHSLGGSGVVGHVVDAIALPPAGVALLVIGSAAAPFLSHSWRLAFWVFVVWLPIEDLIRKFSGNDIRIYVAKDVLFLLLLVAFASHLKLANAWRQATLGVRIPLFALMSWSAALALYASLDDWRVGLLGFRLNFIYVPLVAVGYFLALEPERLSRAIRGLAIVCTLAVAAGLAQYLFGPEFLSPGREAVGLVNLEYYRGFLTASGYSSVFRPAGTFADPGRYAAMVVIATALSCSYYRVSRPGRRKLAAGCIALSGAGLWAAGGRATLVCGAIIFVTFLVGPRRRVFGARLVRATSLAVVMLVTLLALATLAPDFSSNQLEFYESSFLPSSRKQEVGSRFETNTGNIVRGLSMASWLGRGTGTHSLGLQYIYGGEERSIKGLDIIKVESGWGAVAIEIGRVGFGLWVVWSVYWTRRLRTKFASVRNLEIGLALHPLYIWILLLMYVLFFTGYQSWQNYISSAFFWLFSGVIFGADRVVRDNEANPGDRVPAIDSTWSNVQLAGSHLHRAQPA